MINQTQLNRLRALLEKNKAYLDTLNVLHSLNNDKKYSMSVSMSVLMEYFALTQSEALHSITDEGNDNKIDAFYFDDDDDNLGNLVIIQSKYKQKDADTGTFTEDEIKVCIDNCKKIISGQPLTAPNAKLKTKLDDYRELLKDNNFPPIKINLIFATNGITHKGFQDLPEVLDCQQTNIVTEFVDATNFGYSNNVEFGTLEVNLKDEADKTDSIFNIGDNDFSGRVVSTSIDKLMEFYKNTGERLLLNSNVRYLIKNSQINKEICESFIKAPEKFCYLNNGITIISSHFDVHPTGHPITRIDLTNPSIVNGGQTVATLFNLYLTQFDHLKEQFQKAKILLRIYKSPVNYAINIAQATNSQNPIDIVDLKANDPNQLTAKSYLEKHGIGLIVKLGEEIAYYNDTITNENLLQIYAAFYKDDPAKAKSSKGATFRSYYDQVFNANIDVPVCMQLLRCYQVSNFINNINADPVVIKNAFYSLIYTMKKVDNNLLNENIPSNTLKPLLDKAFPTAYSIISNIIEKKQAELEVKFSMNNLFKSKEIKSLIDLEFEP